MRALVRFHKLAVTMFLTAVCAVGTAHAKASVIAPRCDTSDFITSQTPPCPSQSSMLPENYPVMSLSISDESGGYAFVEATVDQVLKAQPSPAPIFFLNVTPEHFQALQRHLQNSGASPQVLQRLRLVQATGYDDDEMRDVPVYLNWQQDIAKGFFDPRTGLPIAGLFMNYPLVGNLMSSLDQEIRSCGISTTPLPTQFSKFPKNGFSGGNIDILPSGICLLGSADLTDEEWENYSKSICGNSPRLKVPTEWLAAHHVDEIFKSVPTNDAAPCDFALAFGSPQKALDLLAQNPNEAAFDFPRLPTEIEKYDDSRYAGAAIASVCQSSASIDWDTQRQHQADANSLSMLSYGLTTHCKDLKNSDVVKVNRADPAFKNYNLLVQQKMNVFKTQILSALGKTLPQCHIKTVDVPQLFVGRLVKDTQGQLSLEPGSGSSVYPNPTNSDIVQKTGLFSEPLNVAFKKDLTQQFSSLGLTVRFIDTFESHKAEGNLHCATQILRYCRPQT